MLPSQQISGLSDEELKWVISENDDRYVIEMNTEFLNDLIENF